MAQRNSRLVGGIYQVGQTFTVGQFLTIYSAYNRNTNDVVGLLVIDLPSTLNVQAAEHLLSPLMQRRFVQSPHVMHVYDWGISEGKAYIATDPPRGITLQQLMNAENLSLARGLEMAIQLTRGVAALQAQGIVDTDLRPQLITVDSIVGQDDRVQIDDVGLRTIFRQLGYVHGQNSQDIEYLDPRYTPPESIYQGIVGSPSDVYQLGVLLFELITGRPPFVGRTPAETGIMQSNNPVPRMNQFKNDTPDGIQAIVDRAMIKNPEQRYPHAMALLAALEALPKPGRQSASGEWLIAKGRAPLSPDSGPPVTKSANLTSEMAQVPIEAMDTTLGGERTVRREQLNTDSHAHIAGIYAYLDFEQEGAETRRIPLTHTYAIVGRLDPKRGITPEIDLTDFDPLVTVSRQHARIRFEKTFFYIEDLKSRNKTRLRELVLMPFKAELLEHGDSISFGSVKLVFRVPGRHDVPVPRNLP